ncbi:MAG: class I SAM-dependent methyltransferase [Chloroflexota bacterium]
MRRAFARTYFDLVYNRLYDATTARLLRYAHVQEQLASLLEACHGDRVLCVGLGTGNELAHLWKAAAELDITGVDFSSAALARARRKSDGLHSCSFAMMDAHCLGFPDNSFDRVLAYHVTDFLDSPESATGEMLRVLKPGGRFVISYPSIEDGLGLGMGLLTYRAGDRTSGFRQRVRQTVSGLTTGFIYLPLMLRPHRRSYSRNELEKLLHSLGGRVSAVDDDPIYHDHIVSGRKLTGGTSSET